MEIAVEAGAKQERKFLLYEIGETRRTDAYTKNLQNWTYLTEDSNLDVVEKYGNYGYRIITLGNMLFAVQQKPSPMFKYTIHDYSESADECIWKNSNFSVYDSARCLPLYVNNNLNLIFANGNIYTISKDEIKSHAGDNFTVGLTKTSTGVTFGFRERGEIISGDNFVVIAESNYNNGRSYYSSDFKNWYDISSTFHSSLSNARQRLVYGNKKFLHFDELCTTVSTINILSEDSISSGWKNMKESGAGDDIFSVTVSSGNHYFPDITDVVFNDKTKQFIMPFYNYSDANGFIIYDSNNNTWSMIKLALPGALYNCIVIDGNLYGFMNNNWVCFTNIHTEQYTDYGKPDNIYGTNSTFRYLSFETPLWDIDKT